VTLAIQLGAWEMIVTSESAQFEGNNSSWNI